MTKTPIGIKGTLALTLAVLALVAGALIGRSALAGPAASLPNEGRTAPSAASKIDARVLADTANGASTSVVIYLADQANVNAAAGMKDQDAQGWYVYNSLKTQADRTQGGLKALLTAQGVSYQSFWVANMIVADGLDAAQVNLLAARSDVARLDSNHAQRWIEDPAILNPQPSSDTPNTVEWGVQRVNAPAVWAMGFTGQGIVVANADTGMRWTHIFIKPEYRGWNGTTADHNYNWHDSVHTGGGACGANSAFPCDDFGHGTHTTGTMVGDDGAGNQVGVAPGAKWIGCRNMDQGNGTPATYTECFQFFIAPTDLNGANPNPALRPHAINNSWGCPTSEGCTTGAELETIVNNTQAAGIFVEASAGNSGPNCSSVSDPPSIYDAAFATGAIDINNNLASFSSRGPSLFYNPSILKPNVSAPGVNVRSAWNTSDTAPNTISGTSMAGPHVVGVVALLWSARPQLARDIAQTKTILQNTANPQVVVAAQTCGGIPSSQIPNNSFGYGRVDALAAVNSVPAQGTPTVTVTGTPPTATRTATGGVATATATRTATVAGGTATATLTPCNGPQTFQGSISNSDPSHLDYLNVQGAPSTCAVAQACPGQVSDPGPFHYDTYTFTNTSGSTTCITVLVDGTNCGGGSVGLAAAAYLTSFDPNNLCANYLADSGGTAIAGPTTFSFNVPAGASFVVDVEEYQATTGCASYTLSVTGLTCPPSATPTPGVGGTATATATAVASATATVAATHTATATPQPTACAISFNDVPVGSTFYDYIRCLACRGIVGGYPCGGPGEPCPGSYYRPNNNVTRGQVSKIVAESAGFSDAVPSTQQTFEDVAPSSTFWLFIERL